MKFLVRVSEWQGSAHPVSDMVFDRRENARLTAERYAGKAIGVMEVVELDDAGNEVRVEEYDPEEGWLSEIGRRRDRA
jgi:hypothetical protein